MRKIRVKKESDKIVALIEEVSSFCEDENIDFKVSNIERSASYFFKFTKEGISGEVKAVKCITVDFTEIDLLNLPNFLIITRIREKITELYDALRNELDRKRGVIK